MSLNRLKFRERERKKMCVCVSFLVTRNYLTEINIRLWTNKFEYLKLERTFFVNKLCMTTFLTIPTTNQNDQPRNLLRSSNLLPLLLRTYSVE